LPAGATGNPSGPGTGAPPAPWAPPSRSLSRRRDRNRPGLASRDLRPIGHLTSGRLDRTLYRSGGTFVPRGWPTARAARPVLHVVMQAQAALPPLPPATSWTVNLQQPHMQIIKSSKSKEQPKLPGHGPTVGLVISSAGPCSAHPSHRRPPPRVGSGSTVGVADRTPRERSELQRCDLSGLEPPTSSLSAAGIPVVMPLLGGKSGCLLPADAG
jgi:hypothetical protein